MSKSSIKPLTSRPLDLLYCGFFALHFICTILIDILPLWPSFLRTMPVSKRLFDMLKGVVDEYTGKTNDPFMLATWGLVQRDWEFLFMTVFMWMELYVAYLRRKRYCHSNPTQQIHPTSCLCHRDDRSSTRFVLSSLSNPP
jgi:hypothetical protein